MATWRAPLREMRFVLHEVIGDGQLAELEPFADATPDLVDAVLEEAAKFCENELQPLNRGGDEEGCTYENGVVRTPSGFREAYKAYCEGGWTGLAAPTEYGGQGLPRLLWFAINEMICAANLSFGTYPGLTMGAAEAIEAHGDEALKAIWLPPMIEGRWTGTMCLTEPHCGTDLGMLRTKAEPDGDGYLLEGTKIFITAGEHDLAENIVHLVLARLPDAPEGVRGISLFLVPKFLPGEDGGVGERNGIRCGSIEHKMGLNGSATCVMHLDEARGWLLGEPHRGMKAMFTMMNGARLGVGVQGLGIAEAAWQGARDYAIERLQGRSLAGVKAPDRPADPIIVHPDVRRMLLTIRSQTEAARALGAWTALHVDLAKHHPDEAGRAAALDLIELMTPVVKAWFTDLGSEAASLGIQVYGGHGYIREHGMEQYARDIRIAQLYEGTNGIQALDLVGRKMGQNMGRRLRQFFHPVDEFLAENKSDKALADFTKPLAKAFGRLQEATLMLAQKGLADPEEAGAGATEYLHLFALTAGAFMWARMARVALERLDGADADRAFYQTRLDTGRFYMARILPRAAGLLEAIRAGKETLMAPDEAAFATA